MPTAKFSVQARGFPTPIAYQWEVGNGSGAFSDVSNGSGYTGAQTKQLVVQVDDFEQDGLSFRCRASNGVLEVTSGTAILHVETEV